MEEPQFEIVGAPIIYTNAHPKPYNPLRRPPVHYKKMLIAAGVYLLGAVALCLAAWFLFKKPWPVLAAFAAWSLLVFFVIRKRAAIWLIHLYQNKAKDETRLRCVYEPSCSEYMIGAINKYGFWRGVIKGLRRLNRCHPPNGGKDYP